MGKARENKKSIAGNKESNTVEAGATEQVIEAMGGKGNSLQEPVLVECDEIGEDPLEPYYGTYKIIEFRPNQYFSVSSITEEEADMMVGRTVILEKDILFTCDTERHIRFFDRNHIITEYTLENPKYLWTELTTENMELHERERERWIPEYFDKINGKIEIQMPTENYYWCHWYYTMEDEDKLILYSFLHGQDFLLERVEDISLESGTRERELEEREQENIRQSIYGSYHVTAFLPTKFHPELDVNGDELLPEEVKLMLGKVIHLTEGNCRFYDNSRWPNSEVLGRLDDGYWLKEMEITEPDYQIAVKMRDKIYGLRDDMLPEEMVQDEYIEISVYPGYDTDGGSVYGNTLLQFYQLEDGRLLMRAMEQYFILEKEVLRMSLGLFR